MSGLPMVKPEVGVKLASIIVHEQEGRSDRGNMADWAAADSLRRDPEVAEYLEHLASLALLPVKR